ncbi:hypothetical protein ACLKA6_015331 [Drosophila palustris]
MKIFICLLATFSVCNATFLSLLGGGGGGGAAAGGTKTTYNVIATPHGGGGGGGGGGHGHGGSYGGAHGGYYAHGHSHGGGSTQLIKIILEDGGHGYGHGGGAVSYGHGGAAGGHGTYGEQVYKVIEHPVAPVAPVAYHAASGGAGYSYAAGHGYGSASSSSSSSYHSSQQLNAILPQIIQLVLQEDALHGGAGGAHGAHGSHGGYGNVDALNGQLIDAFGHKGKAIIMQADKAQGAYFNSGHVVQRGTLKLMKVSEQQQQVAPGGSAGGWSQGGASHGGWSQGGSASSGGWSQSW